MLHPLPDWLRRNLEQQTCACIPDSRPSQTTRRTGHPLCRRRQGDQRPGHPSTKAELKRFSKSQVYVFPVGSLSVLPCASSAQVTVVVVSESSESYLYHLAFPSSRHIASFGWLGTRTKKGSVVMLWRVSGPWSWVGGSSSGLSTRIKP